MTVIIHHTSSTRQRRGIALLAVLFVIMAITILSLGFLAGSSTELASGRNIALRVETDQLAASGLEHARGLMLNPQEVDTEYWEGGTGLQLVSGSSDAYDVTVTPVVTNPNDHCTYALQADAYQTRSGEKVGRSMLSADLRLDPAIALWTESATTLTSGWTLYGDTRCGNTLTNYGAVNGDVFAAALAGTGTRTGQQSTVAPLSLAWPSLAVADFASYATDTLAGTLPAGIYGPYAPVHVLHRSGNLAIPGGVTIDAMLLVEGDLTIQGNNNTITAPKNMPALYVTGDLIVRNITTLTISGLVVVGGQMRVGAGASGVSIRGGLFVGDTLVETTADASSHDAYGCVHGVPVWSPAGGRFSGALTFDGVDDYVQTLDNSDKVQLYDDYTLSLWMNIADTPAAGAGILTKCDSSGQIHWGLRFSAAASRKIQLRDPWSGNWISTDITPANVSGGWHHVCIVHEDGWATSYVDANSVKTWWGGFPVWGYGHLNFGAAAAVSSTTMYKGLLDQVRIYNEGANLTDVSILAAQKTGTLSLHASSLLGCWSFDESGEQVTVSADPMKAALVTWPDGNKTNWSPAAGAFFKRISKATP
jgi:hypothetical protein